MEELRNDSLSLVGTSLVGKERQVGNGSEGQENYLISRNEIMSVCSARCGSTDLYKSPATWEAKAGELQVGHPEQFSETISKIKKGNKIVAHWYSIFLCA